jgi:hypothetical protein
LIENNMTLANQTIGAHLNASDKTGTHAALASSEARQPHRARAAFVWR